MAVVVTTLLSVIVSLLPLCIHKAKRIPGHIEAIIKIFNKRTIDPQTKILLAVILVALTGIIPFIAFSFIPFTGTPVIGLLTFPIACMLAFLLVCLSYEIVIIPLLKSKKVNLENLKVDIEKLQEDYLVVKNKLGPKWEKFSKKATKLLNENAKNFEKFGKDVDLKLVELCEYIEESIEPSMNELTLYLGSGAKTSLSREELDIIQERMDAWKKTGLSGTLSIGVSAGSAVAAKSILVPATLWNTITHSLGFGSGFMVSSMTYSLVAVYAPIALGGVAFLVSMKGLKKLEKNRLSDFLADVIIASTPMIYADGVVHDDEILAIKTLMADPTILDKDRKRVEEAMKAKIKLEDIVANHLMHEKNAAKGAIKSRLLLSIALQIAKADGKVDKKELEVHRKMSRIFKVEENYCQEVRTLLLPVTT